MKQPTPKRAIPKLRLRSGRRIAATTKRVAMSEDVVRATGGNPINPRWTWHHRVLLEMRDRLLKHRGQQLKDAAEPLEAHSMDIADTATDEFDHDLALSRLSAEQDALYEVEEAIRRIQGGTYGICEESGQPIPMARLRVIPWTRFSEEVQVGLEKKGILTRQHLAPVASVRGPAVPNLEEVETPDEEKAEPAPQDAVLRPTYFPPGKHLHRKAVKRRRSRGEAGTR